MRLPKQSDPPTRSDGPQRILIAGEPSAVGLIEGQLERGGVVADLRHAGSVEKLATQLDEFGPRLVIAVHSSDGLDGVAALDLIQEHQPAAACILVVSRAEESVGMEAVRRGAFRWVATDQIGSLAGACRRALNLPDNESEGSEADLERMRALGHLAAVMAHEFNNVLMGIQPFAEIIRRSSHDPQRVSSAADRILQSVRRGVSITQEILRFIRPAQPTLRRVDLTELIRHAQPEFQELAGPKVRLELKLAPSELLLLADPNQIHQVLANLVVNARDAMPNGGLVTLALDVEAWSAEHGPRAHLIVQDDGNGISAALLDQIFEPLFTTKKSGTGLGLPLARQIVDAHGGQITVRSERGHGTTFDIFLPIQKAG